MAKYENSNVEIKLKEELLLFIRKRWQNMKIVMLK